MSLGACLLATVVCASCGGGGVPVKSALAQRNVMAIDEGIDLSVAELQGKVVAAYTVDCSPADGAGAGAAGDEGVPDGAGADQDGDGAAADGGDAFDEVKRRYIQSLMTTDESCGLKPGIVAKPDPLAAVARYRDRWNGMIRGQRFRDEVFNEQEWTEVTGAIDAELMHFGFHGTATSGTVAHDNPDVRLVLIERTLEDPTKKTDDFTCLVQSDLDLEVALLADPDVMAAYAGAPISRYTREFRGVVARYDVGVINVSFGVPPREAIEQLQAAKGCPPVDLVPYYSSLHAANAAFDVARGALPYLSVQAAGNDGLDLSFRRTAPSASRKTIGPSRSGATTSAARAAYSPTSARAWTSSPRARTSSRRTRAAGCLPCKEPASRRHSSCARSRAQRPIRSIRSRRAQPCSRR